MSDNIAVPLTDSYNEVRHGGNVFYKFRSFPSKQGSLSNSECRKKVEIAFDKWERISNFKFIEYDPSRDKSVSKIDIVFECAEAGSEILGDRLAKCEGTRFKTITFDDDIVWADLYHDGRRETRTPDHPFKGIFDFFVGTFDGRSDFLTVACHEIGHALGLGHNDSPDSIMNPVLAGKDNTGWMSSRELGLVDATSLGKIYKLNNEYKLGDMSEIDHFYLVGSMMLYSNNTSTAKFLPLDGYSWGLQTVWRVLMFSGYNLSKSQYRRVYGFFEPSNSPNFDDKTVADDTIVACGGWTKANGRILRPWGIKEEEASGSVKLAQMRTFVDDKVKDAEGEFFLATDRLGNLKQRERMHYPAVESPWVVYGGYEDKRDLVSNPKTSLITSEWGRTNGDQPVQIFSYRTYYPEDRYKNAYGRCVLTLGYL